jgi:hypothetical protein
MAEWRVCSICGGPIRSDNAFGICQANRRCDRARQLARRTRVKGERVALLLRLAADLELLEARRGAEEEARRERVREAARERARLSNERKRERRAARMAAPGGLDRLEAGRQQYAAMVSDRRARGIPPEGQPAKWLDDLWATTLRKLINARECARSDTQFCGKAEGWYS